MSVASSKQTLGLNQALGWCPARVSLETPRLCPFSGLGVAGLRDPKPRPVRSLPFFLLTGSQLVTKVEGSCDGKSASQRSRMAFSATTRPSWAQVGLRATCGPRGKSSLLSRALGWGGGGLCRVLLRGADLACSSHRDTSEPRHLRSNPPPAGWGSQVNHLRLTAPPQVVETKGSKPPPKLSVEPHPLPSALCQAVGRQGCPLASAFCPLGPASQQSPGRVTTRWAGLRGELSRKAGLPNRA